MITAEEFLKETGQTWTDDGTLFADYITADVLIKFARMHCEAQAEAIKEQARIIEHTPTFDDDRRYKIVSPKSIDDAYPLTNIK